MPDVKVVTTAATDAPDAGPARTAAGTPLPPASRLIADEQFVTRFWGKVSRKDSGPSDCWEWQAATDEKGYGRIWVPTTMYAAHRCAFMLASGRWPSPSLMVLHSCDNPKCVNPTHLREGTAQENQDDIDARGRRWKRPGAEHWRGGMPPEPMLRGGSPLSPFDVDRIRTEIAALTDIGERWGAEALLALELGVSADVIHNCVVGRTFRWLPGAMPLAQEGTSYGDSF